MMTVAVIGTGVIGASWVSLSPGRGLDVTAYDPAPDAEASPPAGIDVSRGSCCRIRREQTPRGGADDTNVKVPALPNALDVVGLGI